MTKTRQRMKTLVLSDIMEPVVRRHDKAPPKIVIPVYPGLKKLNTRAEQE